MSSRLLKVANPVSKLLRNTKQGILGRHCSTQLQRVEYQEKNLVKIPPTSTSTITNGIRVATENTRLPTCTVGLWIDVGSRAEDDPKVNGSCHFLEHMLFKGTEKRTQTALELEVENMGAHLNAYTSREQTVFYAKCFSDEVEHAMEILSDIFINSKLDPRAIENEKGVILREMEEVEQNTQEVMFDHLHATAYGGTALGQTILGPSENIMDMTQENLKKFVQDHYHVGSNIVVAAAGGVEHQKIVDLTQKYFGRIPEHSAKSMSDVKYAPVRFSGSEKRMRDDLMPLGHVALAVETCGWDDPDNIPLMIASTIMGNYDRTMLTNFTSPSPLVQSFAEDSRLHSYMTFNTTYTDTGLWGVYLIGEREPLYDAVDNVVKEWIRISTRVTDAEIQRAKNVLKANIMLQLDGSTPICEDIGRQMLTYGRRIPIPELISRIDMIPIRDIKDAIAKYVYDQCPALVALGQIENVPDYPNLRGSTWWTTW